MTLVANVDDLGELGRMYTLLFYILPVCALAINGELCGGSSNGSES